MDATTKANRKKMYDRPEKGRHSTTYPNNALAVRITTIYGMRS